MIENRLRDSNMELLRIIAMLMILILHANFVPSIREYGISPLSSFFREYLQCISVVAVNCFVFISGWFKIRPSVKGFANFVFQCWFFIMGIYIVKIAMGGGFILHDFINCLLLNNNWFYPAYLGLFLISPILNSFVENSSIRQLWFLVIVFYIFQTIYGSVLGLKWIARGYSVFSFIGLYILASTVRRSIAENKISLKRRYLLLSFFVLSLLRTCIQLLGKKYDISMVNPYAYDTPLLVVCTVLQCVYFSKLDLGHNRVINWIAASAFAVFLFHMNLHDEVYRPLMKYLFANFTRIICVLLVFGTISAFFVVAVLIDQPRKWIWNKIYIKVWK